MRNASVFFLSSVVCVLAIGCESDPIGRTVPVQGSVTIEGRPLQTGSIAFWPDVDKGNQFPFEAAAQLSPDGKYTLITRGKPGAPPGAYRVTVTAQEPSDPKDMYSRPKHLVPEAYRTKETTPLRVDVVERPAPGAYDLNVK